MHLNRLLNQLFGVTGVIFLIYFIIYLFDEQEAQYSLLKLPKDLIKYPANPNLSENSLIYKSRHKTLESQRLKTCLPLSSGVLPEQDDDYFISKNVECYNKFNQKYFSLENGMLQLTCFSQAQYFIDDQTSERMIGEFPAIEKWKNYQFPINLNGSEFAFAKCNNHYYSFLKNQFDPEKYKKATSRSESLHNKTGSQPKEMIFIYLLIDSLSRQNFFRRLNQTATFLLSNLSHSNHILYDFFMNNIENFDTVSNFAPMFLGSKLEYLRKNLNASVKEKNDNAKFLLHQNKTALWAEFTRKGFVTLFSTESSKDFISSVTGREILTDHVIGGFWREAARSLKFIEFTTAAQCIAGKMPHDYSLQYLKEFLSNYKGANRAAFIHINTAHEETCTRVKQLDIPLLRFLKSILKDQTEKIILIAADHGRYLNPVNLESHSERTFPAHFVVASESLMKRLDLHKTFQANQDKLLSRLDWYETVKSISKFPYIGTGANGLDELNEDQKKGINLFYTNVSYSRDCKDIQVPSQTCICHNQVLKSIDVKMFEEFVTESIFTINSYISEKKLEKTCETFIKYLISETVKYGPFDDLKESIKILVSAETASKNTSLVISVLNKNAIIGGKLNKNLSLTSSTELIKLINHKSKGYLRVYSIHSSEGEDHLLEDNSMRHICIRPNLFND